MTLGNSGYEISRIIKMAAPHIHVEAPINRLECREAWNNLTETEKTYAYYMAQAAWEGSKVCFFQRSYESPGLFMMILDLFSKEGLQERSLAAGVTEEEWTQFAAFCCGVLTNSGNYRGFGDTKFTPELDVAKFDTIVESGQSRNSKTIWSTIKERVYAAEPRQLGFNDKGGSSGYYTPNVTEADTEMIKRFLASKGWTDNHINSRMWKQGDKQFEIKVASVLDCELKINGEYEFESNLIQITSGDYSEFMRRTADNLSQAIVHSANDTQRIMLGHYINHFLTGDIDMHKDSQRKWIQDRGPVVETDIGFIETYVDPAGIRAEFEGFVSIVNKPVSAKFKALVDRAQTLLEKLPWGPEFEKMSFKAPDFTSLEVIAFAGSGIPIGINIPNYDDIRTNEGYKNVNLGNAYPKVTPTTLDFLSEADMALVLEQYDTAEIVGVALHELLGHGSGTLLYEGKFDPNLVNPATREVVDSCYKEDETWSSRFGKLSNAYEECRAETMALYLSCYHDSFSAFEIHTNWERSRDMIWLYMAYSGVKGLLFYDPNATAWGQAHCRARWAIFRVLQEAKVVNIEFTEDGSFLMHMNYEAIPGDGFNAIRDFLMKLHCYKATGDLTRGTELFDYFTRIDDEALKVRSIIVANQKPRRMNVQPTLKLENGSVQLLEFDETFHGILQSYQARFPYFDEAMFERWQREWALMQSTK